MPSAIGILLDVLDLEPLERNLFRGRSPRQPGRIRVFGGQVLAQALVAASRTVEARAPHSLHAYFMRPGDPEAPLIYEVDRIRDGASFTTRRVVAIQHGEAIFSMSASFHVEEQGWEHQMPMPAAPSPEELPEVGALMGELGDLVPEMVRRYFQSDRAIDVRPVDIGRYAPVAGREPVQRVWFRATERLPDDPAIHRVILAFASDMTLLDTALVAHGKTVFGDEVQAASLDHALWFHRPFRADEWMLYAQDSPFSGGARGLTRGLIYARNGDLIAATAQQGLIRPRRPRNSPNH